MVITCFFAASYVNADIGRYYLGPVLIAWTWLAILAGDRRRARGRRGRRDRSAGGPARASTADRPCSPAGPARCRRCWSRPRSRLAVALDVESTSRIGRGGLARPVLRLARAGRGRPVSWWSYSTPLWYAQRSKAAGLISSSSTTGRGSTRAWASLPDVIDANLGRRPVYVIRQNPAESTRSPARYELETPHPRWRHGFARMPRRSALPGQPRIDRARRTARRTSSRRTTRRPTSRAWSPRRSRRCRRSPRRSRSSPSTTARATARRRSPTSSRPRHPDLVRAVHHPTNLGYGAALRSGFAAARYELIAFTDGDRQFKVADIGRLTARLAGPTRPDVVVGFRIKRADPLIRTAYARAYRLANRIFFGLRVTDVDCACKLFRREALEGRPRRVGRRVLLGRAADQAPRGRAARSSRSASRTTRGRPARRRAPSRRSSSARCATSGGCACTCGRTGAGALRRGEPILAGLTARPPA